MKTQCGQNKEIKFKKDKAVTAPARNGEICLLGARLSGHCTTSWRGVNENTSLLSLYTALLSLLPPLAMSGMNMLIWSMVTEDTWPQKATYRRKVHPVFAFLGTLAYNLTSTTQAEGEC